jgi:hypothetical protein
VPVNKKVNRRVRGVPKHRKIFFGFIPKDKKLHGYGKDAYVQITKSYRGN